MNIQRNIFTGVLIFLVFLMIPIYLDFIGVDQGSSDGEIIGEHKNNTQVVLRLSVADHFEKTVQCGTDIIHYLFNGEKLKTKMDEVNKWQTATGYSPDRIKYQKAIVSTLYTHNKYYLN